MARTKTFVDQKELTEVIRAIEDGDNPPSTQAELWKRAGDELGVTHSVIIGRVKDYSITVKTQPARVIERRKVEQSPVIEIDNDIFEPFTRRGIKVSSIVDITASADKEDWHNIAIREAWEEIRKDNLLRFPNWRDITERKS